MSKPVLITDEWVMSYAAGALSDSHALLVATHAWYHPDVQQRISDAEAIGGAMIEARDEVTLSEGSFDAMMARADEMNAEPEIETAKSTRDTDMPAPLAEWLGKSWDELKWKTMGPGLSRLPLQTGPDGEKLWLLKAKAGVSIPIHDHKGTEMTLVMKGSYDVGDQHFGPGSIEVADHQTCDHQPVIGDAEDCICLVVTEGNIVPHSLIGKMVRPFIGL